MTREDAIIYIEGRVEQLEAHIAKVKKNAEYSEVLKSAFEADMRELITVHKMGMSALRREHEEAKRGVFKTIWETPEVCPERFEHLSRDWSFCPECGRRTKWVIKKATWRPYQPSTETRQAGWECSRCKYVADDVSNGRTNYCPNCGADMGFPDGADQ